MSSEISIRPTLRQKEWEARKKRVGLGLGEIGTFAIRKTKDVIEDIRLIKEKELWREGGYNSFGDFVDRMVGVSLRQVYRLLNADDDLRNVLEISESRMTLCHNEGQSEGEQSTPEKPPEKSLNKAPVPTKKGRKAKPELEPIEATFTEPEAPEKEQLQHPIYEHIAKYGTWPEPEKPSVCPHCGGVL